MILGSLFSAPARLLDCYRHNVSIDYYLCGTRRLNNVPSQPLCRHGKALYSDQFE